MPHLKLRQWLSAGAVIVVLFCFGSVQSSSVIGGSVAAVEISQWPIVNIPVKRSNAPEPDISARSAYITAEESAAVLYSKNATEIFPPASLTKLMTALVARDAYPIGRVFTVPPVLPKLESRGLLIPGEQVSLESLIAAAIISSSNEAAWLLAHSHPEGELGFITMMNQRAQVLGLPNTQYANSIGFDDARQMSTARDSAILAREVLKDPILRRLVATPRYEFSDVSAQNNRILRNTNQLLGYDERISGVKTGTTMEAGQVLTTLAEVNGHSLIFVVLGSADRYLDTLILLDWVEQNYRFE